MRKYILEYINKETQQKVEKEFPEWQMASVVGREIAASVGRRVTIRTVPAVPEQEYLIWYYLKFSDRFILLDDRSYTRKQCARVFMKADHSNGVPVALPKGIRPPKAG